MDSYLRILQRQVELDPQNLEILGKYIRALERLTEGGSPVEPIYVWTVVCCHETTNANDVNLFIDLKSAKKFVLDQWLARLYGWRQDGILSSFDLQMGLELHRRGNLDALENYLDNIESIAPWMAESWYEIERKEIGLPSP